ncbi:MAG TPA: serine hydrolase domain-containing protein [Thermoanaerobaculia bacterium]|nr:serine hydrolase domain-containing protein [Thermoanaerobaculia bacterium]
MKRVFVVLLLILGFVPVAEATRRRAVHPPPAMAAPPAIVTAATQAAENALKAGVPAVQIAVSERGRIIYSAAFGVTDRESGTPATQRSVLQTGSVTKQFTAAAILRLAERGALTLDDRIEKFVPDFNPRGATITFRHLLTHTSGITSAPASEYVPQTRAQFMALIDQPLAFAPGSNWSYSNAGYKLLGYAIESIAGMPYAEFIHTEFALPLGLADTGVCGTYNLPVPEGYGLVQGSWARVPPSVMSVPFSAGAICSTASDLVRWSNLMVSGAVVRPESYAAMTVPTTLTNNSVAQYGFGFFLQKQLGRPQVWHTGGINGFLSSLVHFPEEGLTIAVIINANPTPPGVAAHLIAMEIARAALGIK